MGSSLQNNDLFYLIKGLSGNEKSYYKKLAKRHATNNNSLHLRLFDLIDREQLKDEKKALSILGITNPAQFSSLKNYLTKDLLDTIVFMRRNEDINVQLSFIVIQLEQLLEKKLLHIARKLFKKAWELATYFDHYDAQIQLLQIQNRILEFKSYKEYKTEASEIAARMQHVLFYQHLQQQVQFQYEQLQMLKKTAFLRFTEEQLEEVERIKKALLEINICDKASEWTRMLYHSAIALCEHMLMQFDLCAEYCEAIIAFWKEKPSFINAYPSYFLNISNTCFYNDFAMQAVAQVAHHLSTLKLLADEQLKNDYYRKQWEIISFNTTLKIHHKTARYDKVKAIIRDKAKEILQYAEQALSPAETLSIMSSISISYFVLEEWDEAEKVLIDCKELNREINREDILYFSLVFHLLILFEKKEWYRLDNSIEAAYHLLYSRKKLRPFEKDLMLFLKRLPTAKSKNVSVELIRGFLDKLDDYRNDPVKNIYFLYFNYYGWLESKILGIPYTAYMQEKINGTAS
ncbi:hypothetical protein ACTHGU_06940 [Chitinophagaceae bacterium MMS25-I14]